MLGLGGVIIFPAFMLVFFRQRILLSHAEGDVRREETFLDVAGSSG